MNDAVTFIGLAPQGEAADMRIPYCSGEMAWNLNVVRLKGVCNP